MDPMTLMMLSSMAPSAGSLGLGLYQLIRGSMINEERPTYETPAEITQNVAMRMSNLQGRMAGAAEMERNLQQSQAAAGAAYRRTGSSPSQILQGVSASQGQMNRGLMGLAQAEAQDYQRRLGDLERSRGVLAQYRDQEFEINEMQPYQEAMRTKAALTSAGLQNLFTGSSDMSGSLGQAATMGVFDQQMPTRVAPVTNLPTQTPQPIPQNFTLPQQYIQSPSSIMYGMQPMQRNYTLPPGYINYNPGLMFGLQTAY